MITKIEAPASNGPPLPTNFKFHHNAINGWLEVSIEAIRALDLTKQISRLSYKKEGIVYLEEDLDAILFIRAYLKTIGKPGDYTFFFELCTVISNDDPSPIRNYPPYPSISIFY